MMRIILSTLLVLTSILVSEGFLPVTSHYQLQKRNSKLAMISNQFLNYDYNDILFKLSMNIADTSISEEEVLDATGQASNLPDPLIAVGFAAILLVGVGILQFSLGDLTKEVRTLILLLTVHLCNNNYNLFDDLN